MRWFSKPRKLNRHPHRGWRSPLEQLEMRALLAADPLPVLMVIADQHDFYYREYSDTRAAITAQGIGVVVAATTTNTSYAHANTGQGAGDGGVTPDLALSDIDAEDYSAIVFVGGWGASMYQYAFNDPNGDGITDNYYSHGPYNGDSALGDGQIDPTKIIVNDLIQAFQAQDKHVAAICHGVTVLAWARSGGVSPLSGRHVAVPSTVSAPNQFYENVWRTDGYYMGQYEQVIDNGGIASPVSGSIGNPATVADDVVVDGKLITAENFDSATYFGEVIAREIYAEIAKDNGPFVVSGNQLLVQGTMQNDVIYVWSGRGNTVLAWVNGQASGAVPLPVGGRVVVYGGDGNDRIFATDLSNPTTIYGGSGHDLITGGSSHDILEGGDGVDRISGGNGNDLIRGGTGNDFLYGEGGNNVLLGESGDDYMEGSNGLDLLIGGSGSDRVRGAGGEDVLIGGRTSYDHNDAALFNLLAAWTAPGAIANRVLALSNPMAMYRLVQGNTVQDDLASDSLVGGLASDWYFQGLGDVLYSSDLGDLIS